jgi:hypothetical protein
MHAPDLNSRSEWMHMKKINKLETKKQKYIQSTIL